MFVQLHFLARNDSLPECSVERALAAKACRASLLFDILRGSNPRGLSLAGVMQSWRSPVKAVESPAALGLYVGGCRGGGNRGDVMICVSDCYSVRTLHLFELRYCS